MTHIVQLPSISEYAGGVLDYTLKQLQYFVTAANHGSIAGAAKASHISQAAMSQAITALERIVGSQLIVRHRARGVVLAAVGSYFLRDAQALVLHAEEVQGRVIERQQGLVGPLTTGCYTGLSAFWLPETAHGFVKPNPRLDVKLIEGDGAQLQERMLSGYLDAVLTHTRHLIPGVASTTVMAGRPYVLVAGTHWAANRDGVRLEELADDDFVCLDIPSVREHQLINLRMSGLEPKIAWKSSSLEAVRGMVTKGLGYTDAPIDVNFERV
ncbi:DNA-binding transcriptional regulator, LysR family [Arthrobacter alpinus]|uniref:DNA-binding transcriptional regulator, LysR family n=1 Tax=Arthrobacter alpinus TaxID=656366 RepID=A0A1H5PHG3_9MICC|nr:LysR family transcriptional regulator [Arthrobacter alpinus]SEF13084.1 DNA-binding transcriptional regulator, LysR family [Arthrobacter alpinus]